MPLKSKKPARKKTSKIQPEVGDVVKVDANQLDEVVNAEMDEKQAEVQSSENAGEIRVEESTLSKDNEDLQKTVEPEYRKSRKRKTKVS